MTAKGDRDGHSFGVSGDYMVAGIDDLQADRLPEQPAARGYPGVGGKGATPPTGKGGAR